LYDGVKVYKATGSMSKGVRLCADRAQMKLTRGNDWGKLRVKSNKREAQYARVRGL
jgi:hypothetical protein